MAGFTENLQLVQRDLQTLLEYNDRKKGTHSTISVCTELFFRELRLKNITLSLV